MQQLRNNILFIIIVLVFTYISTGQAREVNIYYNNEKANESLSPSIVDDEILVKANSLAEMFSINLKWIHAINTMELKTEELTIKMRQNSPLIQVGDRVVHSKNGMVDREGVKYIPLKPVLDALGFLVEYEVEDDDFFITQPESVITGMHWANDKQEIVLEMDELGAYRIDNSTDSEKILLEVENAVLSDDFVDDVSDKNFYVRFNRIENKTTLQIEINSRYPIPFHRDGNVAEKDGSLTLSFLPTIDSIQWKNDGLQIMGNGELKDPEMFYLDDPHRLVLDFPETMVTEFDKDAEKSPYINDISVSQYSRDPLTMRVVFELADEDIYLNQVQDRSKGDTLVYQQIEQTSLVDLTYGSNVIQFKTDREIEPQMFRLNDPERLVIDLFNVEMLENIPDEIKVDNNLIEKIRTSDFEQDRFRMVVDLKEKTGYDFVQKEANGVFEYEVLLQNSLKKIDIVEKEEYTNIEFDLSGETKHKIERLSESGDLKIDFSGLEGGISQDMLPDPQGIVRGISVEESESGSQEDSIIVSLEEYHGHESSFKEAEGIFQLSFSNKDFAAKGKIVILDPGHGGFDPGAVGPSGLTEKKVVLDIARRVKDYISGRVDQVFMTRNSDEFVSLRDRVKMANEVGTGIFVSIHANASTKRYSEGTEIYIAPGSNGISTPLGETIYEEVISEIDLKRRGLKQDNFYVIKNVEMPAVLMEVAFLSNPHEETLLSKSVFRGNAAQAIGRGILKYFEED
ncbi:MAG: N-acetylmuramoyl-L-alanine amidase [Halanaerobiaceae bacterium]